MKEKTDYCYLLSVADVLIEINFDRPLEISEAFQPFTAQAGKADVSIKFKVTEHIAVKEELPLFSDTTFRIYEGKNEYYRIFCDPMDNSQPYAFSRFRSDNRLEVEYLRKKDYFMNSIHNAFAYIGFEEIMLRYGAMILHSSFIQTRYGGILFSGSSGIGKSTQADLWREYCDAEILNGDRTIIRKKDFVWKAYGSPYAGSSGYYVNRSAEIRCIILLEKSEDCRICKFEPAEAFGRLYAGLIVNTWNQRYIERITELLRNLVLELPVYRFWCSKDKKAVETLKNILEKEKADD